MKPKTSGLSVLFRVFILLLALACAPEARADVQVGDTRVRVIEVLGDPQGAMQFDSGEWLLYPRGRVHLEDGRVVFAKIEPAEAFASRQQREQAEREVLRVQQQARRLQRIQAGETERTRLMADFGLMNASAEARYRVWGDFQRNYPEVSAEPHLSQALSEYRTELERRADDRRIAELERKVQEVERTARSTRSYSSLISSRYSYYPSVIQPLIIAGYGGYNPYVTCPHTGRRLYSATRTRSSGSRHVVPMSRNEWNAHSQQHRRGVGADVRIGPREPNIRISF